MKLHMVAGAVPQSTQWTGIPCFGTYRYLSWAPMVYLPIGIGNSGQPLDQIRRDYVQVLFPGQGKVVTLKQSIDPTDSAAWRTYVAMYGDSQSELVPGGARLVFNIADVSTTNGYQQELGDLQGNAPCTLTYPDGRKWTFVFFAFDYERSPFPLDDHYYNQSNRKLAPRKFRLTKYVDQHGYETTVTYGSGSMTIKDPSGHEYVCTLGSQQQITKIAVAGRSWSYTYSGYTVTEKNDQTGKTTAISLTGDFKHIASELTTGADGTSHQKQQWYDSNGALIKMTVDGVDTLVTETHAEESIPGDQLGQPAACKLNTKTRVQVKGGLTKTYKYGPFGKLSYWDGEPGTSHPKHWYLNHMHQLVGSKDRNDKTTMTERDSNGLKTKETMPDGTVVTYAYDFNCNLLTKTTPDGVWHYEYDGLANGYTVSTPVSDTVHNFLTREYFVAGGQTLSDTSYTRYPWTSGGNPHPSRGLVQYKDEKVVAGQSRTRRTYYEYNASSQVTLRKSWYSDESAPSVAWAYGYDSWGNRTSETNPLNQTTSYTYDGENRLKTVTDALNHTTTYAYDGIGRKIKVTDANGAYTAWHYDTRGYVDQITGSAAMGGGCSSCGQAAGAGDKLGTYVYADSGLLTSYKDLNNHTWTYTYDSTGRKTGETDPTNYTTAYAYDPEGNLLTVTDANNHVTTYTYDSENRLLSVANGAGETVSYTYDWAGRQLTVSGPVSGAVVATTYDLLGRVDTVTDQRGKVSKFTYDLLGRQTTVTAAYGTSSAVVTGLTYDAHDNVTQTVEDVGTLARTTTNTYDAADRLTQTAVDPAGLNLVTSYSYDAAGRLTGTTVDPSGLAIATSYSYDAVGRQTSVATGYLTTTTTYNAAGWVVSASNGLTTTSYEYDDVGNRTKMAVSGRSPVFYSYNDANRLTGTSQAAGTSTITTSRTPDGLNLTLTSTDPNGNVTTFTYDGANRVKTVLNAAGETTSYDYDAAGRVVKVTAPDGGQQQTAYDLAGNVTSSTDPLNRATGYVYDDLARVTTVTQPDSVVHTNSYQDKLGLVVVTTQNSGASNNAPARVVRQERDIAGRLVQTTTDPSGLALVTKHKYDKASRRVRTAADPDDGTGNAKTNLVTVNAYDALGLVTATHTGVVARPNVDNDPTTLPVTNTYNVAGQLLTTSNGVTSTTLTYDTAGARSSMTVSGRAPVTYTYDSAGRLTLTAQTSGGVTIATAYTLDLGGRVTESTDGEGKVTKFKYDKANRVIAETNPAGETTRYAYDPNGRQTVAALANGSRSVTKYDLAGQVTRTMGGPSGQASYAYDGMGRLTVMTDANGRTKTTGYDGLGRKVSTANEMSQTVQFGYDVAGRWTSLKDPLVNETTWAYDAVGRQTSMTYPAVNGQPSNVESYVYADATGLMSRKTTPNGVNVDYTYDTAGNIGSVHGVNYSRTDGSGAITGIADGAVTMGFTYDAFGRVTGVSDSGAGSLSYAYDKRSLRTSMSGSLPEGMTYAYDDAGRLHTVTKGTAAASTYAYDTGGRRKKLTLTNGVNSSYVFDGSDRLLNLATQKGDGTPVASFGYTVDKVGNRQKVTEKDYVLAYKYDQAYRVTGESRVRKADGLLVYEDAFTYDAAGNRLTRQKRSFGDTEPALQTPYGLWPLDEVKAKPFTPPTAAFASDSDTLALYHLEESESPMVDSSANANSGTIAATVETMAAGKFGGAIRIAPDAQTPGRVEANALALGSGNWTLESWVNPESIAAERTVLAQLDAGGQPVVMLSLADGCPALLVRYSAGGEVGEVRIVGSVPASLNAWQHLAAVRNGLGLYLYMGGQCVATGSVPSGATVLAGQNLVIGCGDPSGSGLRAGGNFAGKIDEVRASSVARYSGLVTPELTGNGPDAELVSGVALTADGRIGPALVFDGTGYVKLTDAGNFLKLGAAKRTIEMWVKAASTSGTQMLYEDGGSTSGFALRINAGNLEFRALNSGTGKTISAAYTSTDWHKVTAVYNEGAMTLFVDDTSVASDTAGFSAVSAQSDGAALGGTLDTDVFGGSTTGGSFVGTLDNVRVLNDAVTPAAMTVENTTYSYNARNQLTLESITGGNHKHYSYNANGENLTIIEHTVAEAVVKTTTMTYDDFGRMLSWSDGTSTETHTYRGAGWERSSTASGGTTTTFLYDGDNVVGDIAGGNFTRQYVTPFLDENLSMTVIGGAQAGTYYYSRDGLGSVRTLTDASQVVQNRYAFSAFGEAYTPGTVVATGLAQRYTFQGREASAVGGPMGFRNRHYSPSLGRFGRRDPLLGGDPLFNAYGFPGTCPVSCLDPMGTNVGIYGYPGLGGHAGISVQVRCKSPDGKCEDKSLGWLSADFFAMGYMDDAVLANGFWGQLKGIGVGALSAVQSPGRVALEFTPGDELPNAIKVWRGGPDRDARLVDWLTKQVGKDSDWLYKKIKEEGHFRAVYKGTDWANWYRYFTHNCVDFVNEGLDAWTARVWFSRWENAALLTDTNSIIEQFDKFYGIRMSAYNSPLYPYGIPPLVQSSTGGGQANPGQPGGVQAPTSPAGTTGTYQPPSEVIAPVSQWTARWQAFKWNVVQFARDFAP